MTYLFDGNVELSGYTMLDDATYHLFIFFAYAEKDGNKEVAAAVDVNITEQQYACIADGRRLAHNVPHSYSVNAVPAHKQSKHLIEEIVVNSVDKMMASIYDSINKEV